MSLTIGKPAEGGTAIVLGEDTKRVARYTFGASGRIGKVSVLMDGLAGGTGLQPVRAVIYIADTDALLLQTGELLVAAGSARQWYDFLPPIGESWAIPVTGLYDLGVIGGNGGSGAVIRVYGDQQIAG